MTANALSPHQKLFENPMASFRIKLKFVWTKKTGKISKVGAQKKSLGKSGDAPENAGEDAAAMETA